MRAVLGNRTALAAILAVCVALIAGSAFAGVVTQRYDFARPVVKLVDGYHVVSMENAWSFGAPGEPVLPIVGARLLVAPGERVVDVRVVPGEKVVLGAGYLVEPGQRQYPLSFTGPIQAIEPAYGGSSTFPGRLNDEPLFGLFRGYGIANVALHPVEYAPADGSLAWYRSLTVELTTEPDTDVLAEARRDIRHDETTLDRVSTMVDNGNDAVQYTLLERSALDSRALDPALAYKYIIITTESWDDYLTTFAAFETQRGFKAGIYLKSWIVANYTGADEQAKIRAFITDAYNTWNIDYVLLVGDARETVGIPHRGLYANGYGDIDTDIPADIYYSAINGTWNTDGDSYFGEPGEEDYYPEVAIGRAAVSTVAHIQNFVAKTMRYLNSPIVGESQKALMVGELLWSSPLTYGDTYKEEVRLGSSANGYTTVGFLPGTMTVGQLYDSQGTWSKAALISLMENGMNIVNHLGHCNVTYAMKMDNPDIASFDNDGTVHSLNFVYSQGCYCGSFDNRTTSVGSYTSDCFAEEFTGDDDGAVSVIMNSRYGWGDPGGTDGSSQYFDREFFDAFYGEHLWDIGTANDDSRTDCIWSINYGANRWCYYELNVFGDPAMHLWTASPTAMTVSHPSAVIVGQPDMDVTVLAGGAVAGARVTIWTDDYSTYGTGVTNAAGYVQLHPNATAPGTLHIKAWAHDHLVYNADITIAPATGPYVVLHSHVIDDDGVGESDGNGDGVINPGETIELLPTMKNVGSVTAYGVTALLTGTNGHVTITDEDDSYGDIVPQATAQCAENYTFVVSSAAANNEILPFALATSDASRATWNSNFNLTVAAPILAHASHDADDPLYWGNGNGCLEAGETVQIDVSLVNTGSAAATNVVATLSTTDPYVRINEAVRGVASIGAGATVPLDSYYSITILPDCPGFHEIDFTLNVVADWGYSATTGFNIMTSGGDFVDNIEAGQGEWTHTNVTGGFGDQWHIETYRYYSATHSWKFGGSGSATYMDSADGALKMRAVCLGTDPMLTFWDWLAAEEESSTSAWDCAFLEITTDGGATWSVITPVGGYSHVKNYNTANPVPEGTPCWSGSHAWRQETFNLAAYSGETVQIRFRFASDGYVTEEGWYVDNVQLTSSGTTLVDDDLIPLEFKLAQNVPNPFNPVTVIQYQLPQSANVKVEIYNVAGKVVRTLVDEEQDAGYKSAVWDGTNDLGQKVASGVYMYRLEAGSQVSEKRMVLLK